MSQSIEMKIHQLLHEMGDPYIVADALTKQWQRGDFEAQEVTQVASFLFNCGFFPTLLSNGVYAIRRKRPVPWPQLAMAISEGLDDDKEKFLRALVKGAKERKAIETLSQIKELDSFCDDLIDIRQRQEEDRYLQYKSKKQLLREELDIARTQQILEQEEAILKKWARLFPKDTENSKEDVIYKERWARKILGEKVHSAKWKQIERDSSTQTETDIEMAKSLFIQMKEQLNKEKHKAHLTSQILNFAIMLQQMDDSQMALKLLEEFMPNHDLKTNHSYYWLLLELYLDCHREIDALAHLEKIEEKYSENPDTMFAISYGRARAMEGIGQKEKAISILRGIVKLRPHYRNAQALLFKLSGPTK